MGGTHFLEVKRKVNVFNICVRKFPYFQNFPSPKNLTFSKVWILTKIAITREHFGPFFGQNLKSLCSQKIWAKNSFESKVVIKRFVYVLFDRDTCTLKHNVVNISSSVSFCLQCQISSISLICSQFCTFLSDVALFRLTISYELLVAALVIIVVNSETRVLLFLSWIWSTPFQTPWFHEPSKKMRTRIWPQALGSKVRPIGEILTASEYSNCNGILVKSRNPEMWCLAEKFKMFLKFLCYKTYFYFSTARRSEEDWDKYAHKQTDTSLSQFLLTLVRFRIRRRRWKGATKELEPSPQWRPFAIWLGSSQNKWRTNVFRQYCVSCVENEHMWRLQKQIFKKFGSLASSPDWLFRWFSYTGEHFFSSFASCVQKSENRTLKVRKLKKTKNAV
jgi:hypothetical protein